MFVENKGRLAMLDTIGESVVRMTNRTDINPAAENKDMALKKVARAVEERPIESSQESTKSEPDAQNKTAGYNVDDSGVFFEKYDKNGKVIYRQPPEQKPIDERV
jgi:hypothetical protein